MNQRRAGKLWSTKKVFDWGSFLVIWGRFCAIEDSFKGSSSGFSTLESWVGMVTRSKIQFSLLWFIAPIASWPMWEVSFSPCHGLALGVVDLVMDVLMDTAWLARGMLHLSHGF